MVHSSGQRPDPLHVGFFKNVDRVGGVPVDKLLVRIHRIGQQGVDRADFVWSQTLIGIRQRNRTQSGGSCDGGEVHAAGQLCQVANCIQVQQ